MAGGFPDPFAYVHDWEEKLGQSGWWHSFELPGGRTIQGAMALAAQKMRIGQFPIPADLAGKRVLDIGAWDGWFAMEMERRGAEVVAIDSRENPRFYEIRELLGSKVEYRQLSVYELDPNQIGRFDVVLFLGVLYHLKHPLLALERVCSVAKDFVAVESFVLKDRFRPGVAEDQPLMEFYENDELGGQFDNWIAPTVPCLMALCRAAGFARVELNNLHEYGAALNCYRNWPLDEGTGAAPAETKLRILGAFHQDNGGLNFRSSSSDDYVCCQFVADGVQLSVDSVRAEVGGFGARPVFVGKVDGCWQANFKLPPGLSAGWHPVRLCASGAASNSFEIAVDLPCLAGSLEIRSLRDGVDWQPDRISLQNGFVSAWIQGLPPNADLHNVRIYVAGKRQFTTFVGPAGADGARQVNARVMPYTPPGTQPFHVEFGGIRTAPVPVQIVP